MNKNRNTPLLKVFQWTALILCLIPCSLFFLLLHAVLAWKKFSLWISEPQKGKESIPKYKWLKYDCIK